MKPGGVIPIAPGPPKPQLTNSANTIQGSRGISVTPKRTRRQSKSGGQDMEMADAEDTNGKALSTARRKDSTTVISNTMQNQNLGSLPMGAMGQGLTASGPQEWEWLTMSL